MSSRDSKIVRDFALSDICVSLCFTNYFLRPYKFWKGYLPFTFHLLAQALTIERTVIGRPHPQCCQMHDNYPPNMIILSIWCDTPLVTHHAILNIFVQVSHILKYVTNQMQAIT